MGSHGAPGPVDERGGLGFAQPSPFGRLAHLSEEVLAPPLPLGVEGELRLARTWRCRALAGSERVGKVTARDILHAELEADLRRLARSREGHFLLESGHHGNLWLDLDALFARPRSVAPFASALADRLEDHDVNVVCGPLVGGAFVSQMVATELDLAFCFTERVINASGEGLYPVEYGLPDGFRAPIAGTRVAVIDDAINAGSAVRGTLRTLRAAGAVPVVVAALLDLGESRGNPPLFDGLPLFSVATLPARLWTPAECPLCAARIPLDSVGTG